MRSMFRLSWLAGLAALALNAVAGPTAPVSVPVLTLGAQAVSTGYELDGVVEAVRQATVSAQATGPGLTASKNRNRAKAVNCPQKPVGMTSQRISHMATTSSQTT